MLNYQLLSKSPISAISINIINNTDKEFAVPQVSFIERDLLPNAVRGQMSVVDGQQRLTTITLMLQALKDATVDGDAFTTGTIESSN